VYQTLTVASDSRGVYLVVLNRPQVHNAFDETLIAELTACFNTLSADPAVRAIILGAEGKSFCAGADLNWMKRAAQYSHAENLADATRLADMLAAVADCSKPTIARVQGNAYGGGVGLIAACDMAVGTHAAQFSLSEVKLGIIPGAISPYVVEAIGARQARRYFLTAERFPAADAYRLGLLHDICLDDTAMDERLSEMVSQLLLNGPNALHEAKLLIAAVSAKPISAAVRADTAERIARVRGSAEGREGVAAFLEKRKANWIPQETSDE
jgi:methylglutaconyl-CoA hydratase